MGPPAEPQNWAHYSTKQLHPVYLLILKFPFAKNPVASHDRDLNYLRNSWLNKNSSSVVNTDEVTQDLGVAGGWVGGEGVGVSSPLYRSGKGGKENLSERRCWISKPRIDSRPAGCSQSGFPRGGECRPVSWGLPSCSDTQQPACMLRRVFVLLCAQYSRMTTAFKSRVPFLSVAITTNESNSGYVY